MSILCGGITSTPRKIETSCKLNALLITNTRIRIRCIWGSWIYMHLSRILFNLGYPIKQKLVLCSHWFCFYVINVFFSSYKRENILNKVQNTYLGRSSTQPSHLMVGAISTEHLLKIIWRWNDIHSSITYI